MDWSTRLVHLNNLTCECHLTCDYKSGRNRGGRGREFFAAASCVCACVCLCVPVFSCVCKHFTLRRAISQGSSRQQNTVSWPLSISVLFEESERKRTTAWRWTDVCKHSCGEGLWHSGGGAQRSSCQQINWHFHPLSVVSSTPREIFAIWGEVFRGRTKALGGPVLTRKSEAFSKGKVLYRESTGEDAISLELGERLLIIWTAW